jgi:hypothetical protein
MDHGEVRRILAAGIPEDELRRAETALSGQRSPLWEQQFAKLARERAWELNRLAESLEGISVTFDLDRVALDRESSELILAGRLASHGSLAPDTVWLFAYLLHPNHPDGSWSHVPIKLGQPFAAGERVDIEERTHTHWTSNEDLPRSGYYARVSVFAQSDFDVIIPPKFRNRDIEGAVSVEIL